MHATETYDLSVCVDCLAIMANGTLGAEDAAEDAAHAARMAEQWPGFHLVPACPEDCEGHFSWARCEGCGSSLGGDRHPATAFARKAQS